MEVSSIASVPLKYRVVKCTGHSGTYEADNILVDNPTDQTSRWSGSTHSSNVRQWILLELAEPSLVRSITFGKFYKAHPCNMKEFKIFVGRTMDKLSLALHGGLMNDSIPETFEFQRTNRSGLLVPIRYIKVVPISAHGPKFNTSIWYVALSGVNEPRIVKHAREAYTQYLESHTLRHVLKFLRQKRYLTAYDALLRKTDPPLEHDLITRIYNELMLSNWSTVESLIATAASEGLFDQKISLSDPKAVWSRLNGNISNESVPSARGGHQMCIDVDARTIYLFGGWNGHHDLDDLWSYSIDEQRWQLLARHTAENDGPSPRSCHKMAFDPLTGYLYILGRVGEVDGSASAFLADVTNSSQINQTSSTTQGRGTPTSQGTAPADDPKQFTSDFFRYSTRGPNSGEWTLLSEDTAAEEGPCLIYDHQIALDSDKQILYVSGGRIVDGNMDTAAPMRFSGFYQYHIMTGKWERILDERAATRTYPGPYDRYGHSMVFDPIRRRLIIMAGKTGHTFLTDMYIYDVDSRTISDVTTDFTAQDGPDPSFCQRAVVDPETGYLFTTSPHRLPGFLKSKSQKSPNDGALQSAFWIFKPDSSTWTKVSGFRPTLSETDWQTNEETVEPPPRYAHEMVYDTVQKVIYVHGGNSGHEESQRLDDFWSMKLVHPTRDELVRKATYIVRRQQFKELCEVQSPVQALTFLQQEVYSMVDHSSDEETQTFRALHSHLFEKMHTSRGGPSSMGLADGEDAVARMDEAEQTTALPEEGSDSLHGSITSEDEYKSLDKAHFTQRTEVFETLLDLVNSNAKQPDTDLVNIMEEIDLSYA